MSLSIRLFAGMLMAQMIAEEQRKLHGIDIECSYTDEVVCPYCGHKHDASELIGDQDEFQAFQCENEECGREFRYTTDHHITFNSYKLTEMPIGTKVKIRSCYVQMLVGVPDPSGIHETDSEVEVDCNGGEVVTLKGCTRSIPVGFLEVIEPAHKGKEG